MELTEKCKKRVSVLTPVHNTAIELLQKAFNSLRKQSFGFVNIQWVVVLHNCSDVYVDAAKRMFAGYTNISCTVLSAEGAGVSYARNATLHLVEGEYIFFFDADDEMMPSCIERVVAEMDSSNADTAIFTAVCRTGSSVVSHWTDTVSAPGVESVVFEKGDPRIGKSMCASGMTLWTRCYRRDFLLREGIIFNESFSYAEDFLFNIHATGTADKICILPEFCGYVYNIGIGMTTEMLAKNDIGDVEVFLMRLYTNTQKAIRDHVEEEDKLTERIVLSGQNRQVVMLNESGMYSLILSSKLPTAKKFKHWVTSEVLPTIHRYGMYAIEKTFAEPRVFIGGCKKVKSRQRKNCRT